MFKDMSGFQEGKHGGYTAAASPCDRPAAELRMYPSEGKLIHAKRRDCRLDSQTLFKLHDCIIIFVYFPTLNSRKRMQICVCFFKQLLWCSTE